MLRLPPRMEEVLLLVYGEGFKEVDVAGELGISKQAVSKALREARGRLAQMFLEVADLMGADLIRANVEKGYAILKVRQTGQRAYVFYIPGKGPKIIFKEPLESGGGDVKVYEEVINAAVKWGMLDAGALSRKDPVKELRKLIKRIES